MKWMLLPFRRYADFRGRSRRREFWMFQLFNFGVAAALMLPAILIAPSTSSSSLRRGEEGLAASASFHSDFSGSPVSLALVTIFGLYWLAILVPSIAVTVRRLHDRNRSGWWYVAAVVPIIIPFLGLIPALALLVFLLLPGTAGDNRFGADPKDPYSEEVFA
jgi:uncharacterized membrane protein YhaH (DUF805 family)